MPVGGDRQGGAGVRQGGYNAWINFNWRGTMKKYLFGLGAMLVGAGLSEVFTTKILGVIRIG